MIQRLLAAAIVLFAGLGLVIAAGPLRRGRPVEVAARPPSRQTPVARSGPRGGLANGVPFTYATGLSRLSPEALITDFKAKGVESQQGDASVGLLPPLQALPAGPGIVSAVRWSRASPQDPPMPEVLLVFGRNPSTTYQLRMAPPTPASREYRPLQDLEARLGIIRSGLQIEYGVLDTDGSWVFIGKDPARRILSPGFSATMESVGWERGPKGGSRTQTAICFSRWNQQVCFSRDEDSALMVSKTLLGAMFSTNRVGAPTLP